MERATYENNQQLFNHLVLLLCNVNNDIHLLFCVVGFLWLIQGLLEYFTKRGINTIKARY